MQNTIYAIIAASLAMLATSGIVALASEPPAPNKPLALVSVVEADDEADDYVSEFIDREYRKLMAEQRR